MAPKYAFLALLFIVSCSAYNDNERTMSLADSLMDSFPDSALALMEKVKPEGIIGKKQNAKYALFMTMARDKNYIVETDDSLARIAYNYYSQRPPLEYRLKATYYYANIHHYADRYVEAAFEFMEAEPLAKRLGDYHYLGLIYWHLYNIYASNYDYVHGLGYAEKALEAYQKTSDSVAIDYSWLDLARAYVSNDKWQEALPILDSLMMRNAGHDYLFSYSALLLAKIIAIYNLPDVQRAWTCYEEVNKRRVVPFSVSDICYMAFLSERAGNRLDSDSYLGIAESLIRSEADSAIVFNGKQMVYELRGTYQDAFKYQNEAMRMQNQVVRRQLDQSISNSLQQFYQEQAQMVQERNLSLRIIITLICFIVMALVALIIAILKRRRDIILHDLAAIEDVSKDLEIQRERNVAIAGIMDSFISDKVSMLQHLSKTYYSWEEAELAKRDKTKGKDTREEVISRFRHQLADIRDNHSFVDSLEDYLNITEEGIVDSAKNLMKKKNKREEVLLTLLLSGFSVKSISFLLRMSEPSVRMQKSRFKSYFNSLPSAKASEIAKKLSD